MSRHLTSRGELLRLMHEFNFNLPDSVAANLGFNRTRKMNQQRPNHVEQPKSPSACSTPKPTDSTATPTRVWQPETQLFWVPKSLIATLETPASDENADELAANATAINELPIDFPLPQLSSLPLVAATPPQLATRAAITRRLRPALAVKRRSGIDFDRLVRQVSRGQSLLSLPYRSRLASRDQLIVVIDRSRRLVPYWNDQDEVLRAIQRFHTRSALRIRGVEDNDCHSREFADQFFRELVPDIHSESALLVLGDLGCLTGERSIRDFWHQLGRNCAAVDLPRIALVPFPGGECPPALRQVWSLLEWESGATAQSEAEREQALRRLLGLVSRHRRLEPGLLREIRRLIPEGRANAGLEGRFWGSPVMRTRHCAAGTLRKQFTEDAIAQLAREDELTCRRVSALTRKWRTRLASVWCEEGLDLRAICGDTALVPGEGDEILAFLNGLADWLEDHPRPDPKPSKVRAWVRGLTDEITKKLWQPTDERPLNTATRETILRLWKLAGNPANPPPGARPGDVPTERTEVSAVHVCRTQEGWDFQLSRPQVATSTSPLATVRTINRSLQVVNSHESIFSRDEFWAAGTVPSWAGDWGMDDSGLWADLLVLSVVKSGHAFAAISDRLSMRQRDICETIREVWKKTGKGMSVDDIGERFAVSPRFGLGRDIGVLTDGNLARWTGEPMNSLLEPVRSSAKTQSVAQRLRWIPAGKFVMGSPEDEPGRDDDEGPQHEVTITQGFWMFDTPCTQAFYQAVTGENPSKFRTPDRPVENVSWEDAQKFLEQLQSLEPGIEIALPTEAEWEYACRAGTTEALYSGAIEIVGQNNAPSLHSVAWYGGNCGVDFDLDNGVDAGWPEKQFEFEIGGTRKVRLKNPNPSGLFDMLGNVREWCQDVADTKAYERGAVSDPLVESSKSSADRVVRGGGWDSFARYVRAAFRYWGSPDDRNGYLGFRCRVRGAEPSQAAVEQAEQARRQTRAGKEESPERAVSRRSERSRGDSSPASGERSTASGPAVEQTTWIQLIDQQETSTPVPQGPVAKIISDIEVLTLAQIRRPDWAYAIGRDEFGLWADLKVHGQGTKPTDAAGPTGTVSAPRVRLRWIPPGQFMMGSPKGEPGRFDDREFEPHPKLISKGFWLFDAPVTQALWEHVMGEDTNESRFRSADRPVENVSWLDCEKFCTRLSGRTGLDVSLPAESEWEYACRAGTSEATYAGPIEILKAANAPILHEIAWYRGNSNVDFELEGGEELSWSPAEERQHGAGPCGTHAVRLKAPNPWGLYDMLGNVYEWCSDVGRKPGDSVPDEVDEASALRVVRGGSWHSLARSVRAACRDWGSPDDRDDFLGFRCRVREFQSGEESSDSVSAEPS